MKTIKSSMNENLENISENQREKVHIDGKDFLYIKNRLIGGKVYASQDKSEYLRTANTNEIEEEVNLTQDLFGRGFPVPEVITRGTLENGVAYYIECSIGEEVFGDIFLRETKEQGCVSDKSFNAFLECVKVYSQAQFNPKNFVHQDQEILSTVIALDNVLRNNPPSSEMEDKLFEAYANASKRLMHLPWGYLQADLNAFNILEKGIIDFELAGFGPVGYDVLTNLYFGRMWPKDRIAYVFNEEQIARYTREIDKLAEEMGLPKLSDYLEDFLVLKSIWASGKDKESEDHPERHTEFWEWRVKVRDWCINQYLKGEAIDSSQFEKVGSA